MSKPVINFMGDISFQPSLIEKLKLVLSSGIFGEPKYYSDTKCIRNRELIPRFLQPFLIINTNGSAEKVIERIIDEALTMDYKATVSLIPVLRNELHMRKNSQVLAIRAVIHPGRVAYTSKYGVALTNILLESISRPDDIEIQLEYLMSIRNKEQGPKAIPGILKRVWSKKIESFDRYRMMKYGTSLIDAIRLSHAKGLLVGELLKNGKVKGDSETTWERLRSDGKSWGDIVSILTDTDNNSKFPHMALLRNIRSIASDNTVTNTQLGTLLEHLEQGVQMGKQFPFRYYSAYKEILSIDKVSSSQHDSIEMRLECVKDALNSCIEKSIENIPKLKGNTIALCDNSGSAWGVGPSGYSKVRIAEIANLAGIMAISVSKGGTVVTFGDRFREYTLTGNILSDLNTMCTDSRHETHGVGQNTEAGIWLYLDKAIKEKIHIDNLFIYSDMQAGTGNLYGTKIPQQYRIDHNDVGCQHINIPKMIAIYRKTVNPKLNVFSIQIAGYDNSVLPMYMYRGTILSGWTGSELLFASQVNRIWDKHDSERSNTKKT